MGTNGDRMSNNDLVIAGNGLVSDEVLSNYADWLIESLDEDFTPDKAGQTLADLAAISEASKWAEGDVLVYTRIRMGKTLLGKAVSYLEAKYEMDDRFGIQQQLFPAVEILDWKIYCHDDYWILEDHSGGCRIWKTSANLIDERGFNRWIAEMCGEYVNQLSNSWKTKATRYRTSIAWPRHRRNPAWSWSIHAELSNLSGGSINATDSPGLARLPEKIDNIDILIDQLEEGGAVTIGRIREMYRQQADIRQGYAWVPPMPRWFYIHDTLGKSYMALRFVDMDADGGYDPQVAVAQIWIMQMAGVMKPGANLRLGSYRPEKLQIDDEMTEIRLADGRLVATMQNMDNKLVRKAVEDLVLKLEL